MKKPEQKNRIDFQAIQSIIFKPFAAILNPLFSTSLYFFG
jgi:hypothetical protein